MQRCWDLAVRSAGGLAERCAAAAAFNASSRFRKRGLAVVPTKFGISFTTKFLNQVRQRSGNVFHGLTSQKPSQACVTAAVFYQVLHMILSIHK